MPQLRPAETLPISRQLEDPTDGGTRYLRVYIYKKKGKSEELLATLDMTDESGQRFTSYYQAPQDSDPYYLNVIIKVFDDSGYTTESMRYARTEQTYLVAERWGLQFQGGGASVSYDKIRRIIQEEVEKLPKPTSPKEIDLKAISKEIREVDNNIKGIAIPKQEKLDLDPVLRTIKEIKGMVLAIHMPKPEKLDLSPISKEMTGMAEIMNKLIKFVVGIENNPIKEFKEIKKLIEGIPKPEKPKRKRII